MIIRQRRGKQISALLLMTVILCCGCSNHSSWQKAKDRYVVGVVTKSNTSEYWMSVNSGMEAAAAKYDMDVITLAPDSELDREVQEKQVEKLIDQNVDALAVAPIDSYHVPDYLDEIEKKKITAVCFDNGMVGGELPYIGIDNHKTGYSPHHIRLLPVHKQHRHSIHRYGIIHTPAFLSEVLPYVLLLLQAGC